MKHILPDLHAGRRIKAKTRTDTDPVVWCSVVHRWGPMPMLPPVWQVNKAGHYCKNQTVHAHACAIAIGWLDLMKPLLACPRRFDLHLRTRQPLPCLTQVHFSTHPCTLRGFGLPRQWSNRLWDFGTYCISCLPNLATGTSHFLVKSAKSLQCLVGNGLLERQCTISCWSLSLPCQC